LPYGHQGTHPPAPPHITISQHAAQQVYDIKTRENYSFYYVFISYFKAQRIVDVPCLSVCRLCSAESIILSVGSDETITLRGRCLDYHALSAMMLSACAESMIVSVPPAESMILSALCDPVIMLISC
jgi:hypothetical protein